jgi:ADP-ribose pyrophosphatase YjhB (NUDIX family)
MCVLRKLREETGLKVHLDQLIYLRSAPLRRPGTRLSHLGHYYVVIYSATAAKSMEVLRGHYSGTAWAPSPQSGDTVKGAAWFPLHTAHRLQMASGLAECLFWAVKAAGRFAGSITRLGREGWYAALQAPSGSACTCFERFGSEDCTGTCSLRAGSEAPPGMATIGRPPGDIDLAPCCDRRCEVTNQALLQQCGFAV